MILLVCAVLLAGAAAFPAAVEFDVVFPRNESWMTTPVFPVIVALQNAPYASGLDPQFSYSVRNVEDPSAVVSSGTVDMAPARHNYSSDFIVYFYSYMSEFGSNDTSLGLYRFDWQLSTSNCTQTQTLNSTAVTRTTSAHSGSVTFGVFLPSNGATPVDVYESTRTCPARSNPLYNQTTRFQIERNLYASLPGASNISACASLSAPVGTPDPCRIQPSPSEVESILAAMTAQACQTSNTTVDCSRVKNAAAAVGGPSMFMSGVAVSAWVGFLLMTTAGLWAQVFVS